PTANSGEGSGAAIRLVAGLGNPGPEYATTRHNIGFMVVDLLAARFGAEWEKSAKWEALSAKCGTALLVKPLSFMNRSGHPLLAACACGPAAVRAGTTAWHRSWRNSAPSRFRDCASASARRRPPERSITY